jgi:hypothetical protein
MILDKDLLFTSIDGEAVTSSGGSVDSGGSADLAFSKEIDLGKAADAVGANRLTFYTIVKNGGSMTGNLQVKLQTAAAPVSSGASKSYSDMVLSPVVSVSSGLKAGDALFACAVPNGAKQYLRVVATVTAPADAAISSGTVPSVVAFLTKEQR